MSAVNYNPASNIAVRFYDHLKFGTQQDLPADQRGDTKKNVLEKMGDAGLWGVEKLPKMVWEGMKNPKVVTVAVTVAALFALTIGFYPALTVLKLKAAVALLPTIPLWTVKFAVYISLVELTLATAFRAQGRFFNEDLMKNFYNPKA